MLFSLYTKTLWVHIYLFSLVFGLVIFNYCFNLELGLLFYFMKVILVTSFIVISKFIIIITIFK